MTKSGEGGGCTVKSRGKFLVWLIPMHYGQWSPPEQNDRHDWKHYLPLTPLVFISYVFLSKYKQASKTTFGSQMWLTCWNNFFSCFNYYRNTYYSWVRRCRRRSHHRDHRSMTAGCSVSCADSGACSRYNSSLQRIRKHVLLTKGLCTPNESGREREKIKELTTNIKEMFRFCFRSVWMGFKVFKITSATIT